MLCQGQDILSLLPQRSPIVMVDALLSATSSEAETLLTITADNMFVQDDCFQESGLIEHIAQSAAAYLGYQTHHPSIGYIGEIKKFHLPCALPRVGDCLHTRLHVLGEAMGITLVAAETFVQETKVCTCQMKIFLKDNA